MQQWIWPIFGCKVGQNDMVMMIPKFYVLFQQLNVYTKFQIDVSNHVEYRWTDGWTSPQHHLTLFLTYIKGWPLYSVLTSCKHVHLSYSYGFRQCIFACFIKQKLGQCIHIVNKILMNSSQHISSENVQHTGNISKNYILIYQSYFQLIIHWALITVKVTMTDWQLVWSKQYGTQNILIIIKINNP